MFCPRLLPLVLFYLAWENVLGRVLLQEEEVVINLSNSGNST